MQEEEPWRCTITWRAMQTFREIRNHRKGSASRETLYTAAELYPGTAEPSGNLSEGHLPAYRGELRLPRLYITTLAPASRAASATMVHEFLRGIYDQRLAPLVVNLQFPAACDGCSCGVIVAAAYGGAGMGGIHAFPARAQARPGTGHHPRSGTRPPTITAHRQRPAGTRSPAALSPLQSLNDHDQRSIPRDPPTTQ